MRILVTGHHGYIGPSVVSLLSANGHEVIGLDSDLFVDCLFGGEPAPEPSRSVRDDIRDVDDAILEGVGAVLHLAALSNDPLGDISPQRTMEINHEATLRLARMSRDAGVSRFLFSSSCSVYGYAGEDDELDEDAPLRPLTAYAESKVRCEEGLKALEDDSFCPVFARNATVYGLSPRLRTDLVLNNLVASAHVHGEVRVIGDGTAWRPLVHVDDVAGAFLALLRAPSPDVRGRAFNVGSSSQNYRVRELADIAAAASGGSVTILGQTGKDDRSYRVDFGRLRRITGYETGVNAREGADQLAAAFQKWGLHAAEMQHRYSRLSWLARLRESGVVDETLRRPARARS